MKPEYDEIGIWSEVKLAIIKDYASAYARILDKTRRDQILRLRFQYIGAFAGPGVTFRGRRARSSRAAPLLP